MALVNGSNYDHIDLQETAGGDIVRHMLQDTAGRAMLAPIESSSTASMAHVPGTDSEYFVHNNKIYQATSPIAQGGTIVTIGSGANCKEAPLGAAVSGLNSAVEDIVLVQSAQPTSEDNRIWIPGDDGQDVNVPTYEEFEDLKSAISDIDDVLDMPATASGTTPADNNANKVLDGLSLIKGHSYKYEVTFETASDVAAYLSMWMTGGSSYFAIATIAAGSKTGYGTINNTAINVPSAYMALTTGGRALKYTVKFTDLTVPNKIAEIENSITALGEEVDTDIAAVRSEMVQEVGIYDPPSASGKKAASSGNSTIIDNLTIVQNRKYQIDLTIDSLDAAAYINLWDGTSQSYTRIWTISANTTSFSTTFVAGFSSEIALLKLDTQGRATAYSVKFSDVSSDNLNGIEKNANNIELLSDETTIKNYNKKITKDVSQDCTYAVGEVTADGGLNTSATSYMYTNKISVNPGDVVYMLGHTGVAYGRITAYYNGTAIPEKTATNIRTYTVPDGVNQIVITVVSNAVKTDDLIVIDYYSSVVNSEKQIADDTAKNHSHTYAKRTPMITFIDDDGNVECYTDLLPIFKAHNIPLVSAYMGDTNPDMTLATMMTEAQCREIVQNGGEIIVHYNPSLTDLTLDEAERVILKSKYWLEKHGFYSRLLVYSNGTSNSAIRAMVSKHFDAGFSGAYPRVSNTDRSNHGCIVQYAIHREPCGGLYYDNNPASRSLQYFKDMIDECIASNGWLVFTMHSWLMPEGKQQSPYDDTDQLGLLEDIIEYIEEKQQGGSSIKVVTASEGLDTFGNAWQAGDYLGHWNEQTLTNTATIGDHSEPGCAINKLGQYDFPAGNNITPQGN